MLIAEYLWGYNYQGDYNFLSNQSGTVTATNRADLNNKVQEQILEAGIALRF